MTLLVCHMASLLSSSISSIGLGYSNIEQIALAVWLSRFSWSREMAMFTAYFDEAGHPRRKLDLMVVGGGIAPIEQWDKFELEWEETLKKFELDSAFHSTDFDSFESSKYSHLTDLHNRLTGIICTR